MMPLPVRGMRVAVIEAGKQDVLSGMTARLKTTIRSMDMDTTEKLGNCSLVSPSNADCKELLDEWLISCSQFFHDGRPATAVEAEDRIFLTPDMIRIARMFRPKPVKPVLPPELTPEMAKTMLVVLDEQECEKRIAEHRLKMEARTRTQISTACPPEFVEKIRLELLRKPVRKG